MMVAPEWGGSRTRHYKLHTCNGKKFQKVDASVGVIMSVNNSLVCFGIEKNGALMLRKKKYLKPLATGEKLGCFLSFRTGKPESDATQQRTTAVLQDDHYVLKWYEKTGLRTGTKADYYLLQATTDKSKGYKGITTFIIEKAFNGVEIGKKEE